MHPTRAAARQTQAAETSAQAIVDMQRDIAILLDRTAPGDLVEGVATLIEGVSLATAADLARIEGKIDQLLEQLTGAPPSAAKRGTHHGQ